MSRRSMQSCRSRTRAMTLIEVLAGLVVLGTVLVSVTIARGRFMQQAARAAQELQATRAVDAMMSRWLSGPPEAIPVPARGALDASPELSWQTSWRFDPSAGKLAARVVHLELFSRAEV